MPVKTKKKHHHTFREFPLSAVIVPCDFADQDHFGDASYRCQCGRTLCRRCVNDFSPGTITVIPLRKRQT